MPINAVELLAQIDLRAEGRCSQRYRRKGLLVDAQCIVASQLSDTCAPATPAPEARTPERQEVVLAAVRFKCDVLWAQLDALHFAYVDPALPPPGAFVPEAGG